MDLSEPVMRFTLFPDKLVLMTNAAISQYGSLIAVGSNLGVFLFDFNSGEAIAHLGASYNPGNDGIRGVVFSDDGKYVVGYSQASAGSGPEMVLKSLKSEYPTGGLKIFIMLTRHPPRGILPYSSARMAIDSL